MLKGTFLGNENDEYANKIDMFLIIFNVRKDEMFGDAVYQLNQNRQIRLRKPFSLPLDYVIKLLQGYILTKINELTCNDYMYWDPHRYVMLRDCCCAHLTLFNALRGGEPA